MASSAPRAGPTSTSGSSSCSRTTCGTRGRTARPPPAPATEDRGMRRARHHGLAIAAALAVSAAFAQAPIGVTAVSRAVRPGEIVLLTVTTLHPVTGVSIRAFGRDWPAWEDGARHWRALIGIDLDTRPGAYEAEIAAGA